MAAAVLCVPLCWAQDSAVPAAEEPEEEVVSEGIPDYIVPRDENRKAGEVPAMFRDDAMPSGSPLC